MTSAVNVVDEWPILTRLLPDDWTAKACELGALRRARQIPNAAVLLRLLLLHLGCGWSLRDTAVHGSVSGLATISDAGLWYRLRHSGAWLQYLGEQLLTRLRPAHATVVPLRGRRVLAVDGTLVREDGPTGACWRLHDLINVATGGVVDAQVTDPHGAESLTRFTLAAGDLVLADRGSSRPGQVAHALAAGADFLGRFKAGSMVLRTPAGAPFALCQAVRRVAVGEVGDDPVQVVWAGGQFRARLCVVRQSAAATARERRRIRDRRRRKGTRQPLPATETLAGYTLLLTTLDEGIAAATVCATYAMRWQVELIIKRHKGLFRLGHLPKRHAASIHAWLQGKLLLILLAEGLRQEATACSPWGDPLHPTPADALA